MSSVASDIFGTGGMSFLRLIAQGTTDPDILLAAIKTSLKKKKGYLRKSLTNKLTENHCFLVKQLLGQYDQLKSMLNELTIEIERRLEPHDDLVERLAEIPGIGIQSAQAIVAEATALMDSFRDDRAFAAWAGTAPGNRESAGKKRVRIRQGNPALKKILVQSAMGAIKTKGSFFLAKHNRLRFQLGSYNKATVAIANRLARIVFHLIRDPKTRYKERGGTLPDESKRRISSAMKTLKE